MNLAGKNIKCIAFDLDHTVINSDGTMSDATRTVIEQAIAEGIEIIPVSYTGERSRVCDISGKHRSDQGHFIRGDFQWSCDLQ